MPRWAMGLGKGWPQEFSRLPIHDFAAPIRRYLQEKKKRMVKEYDPQGVTILAVDQFSR
jgi:hypothetical protein